MQAITDQNKDQSDPKETKLPEKEDGPDPPEHTNTETDSSSMSESSSSKSSARRARKQSPKKRTHSPPKDEEARQKVTRLTPRSDPEKEDMWKGDEAIAASHEKPPPFIKGFSPHARIPNDVVVWMASVGRKKTQLVALYSPEVSDEIERAYLDHKEWVKIKITGSEHEYWVNTSNMTQHNTWGGHHTREVSRGVARLHGDGKYRVYKLIYSEGTCFQENEPSYVKRGCDEIRGGQKVATDTAYVTIEANFTCCEEETYCKMVLDSGATSNCGSVPAIQALQKYNLEQTGYDGVIDFDKSQRQTFKFGDAGVRRGTGSVEVEVMENGRAGGLRMQAIDTNGKYVPMLASIQFLRERKAVVDYGEDTVIFKAIDPRKIIKLERATNGHLLLDLRKDLTEQVESEVMAAATE